MVCVLVRGDTPPILYVHVLIVLWKRVKVTQEQLLQHGVQW